MTVIKDLEEEKSNLKARLSEIEDELSLAPNQLEREFRGVAGSIGIQIDEKLREAAKLLGEACDLADKYGIPFKSDISEIRQAYFPPSFKDKYSDLDRELVHELTDAWPSDYGRKGWEHSAVC